MSTAVIDNDTGAVIPEETKTNISLLDKVSAGLSELQAKHTTVPDCTTDEGYSEAKALAKEVARVRIDTEKAHKGAKSFYLEGGRRIDAMKNSILDVTAPIEQGYKSAIKAVDDETARIEREAAEKEQARIEAIESSIRNIESLATNTVSLNDTISAINYLNDFDLMSLDEFSTEGEAAITSSLSALNNKRDELKAQAEEAARLDAQRKEQEEKEAELRRQQEAIEAQKREIEEAQRAEEQLKAIAEAERRAQEKAEQDKKEALERAEREKVEAAKRAEIEKAEAIEKAKQQAIEDERKRQELAEQKAADEKAEAERLAALKPDTEQLAKWIHDLGDLRNSLPEMKSPEGQEAVSDISEMIRRIELRADKLFDSQEEAAA